MLSLIMSNAKKNTFSDPPVDVCDSVYSFKDMWISNVFDYSCLTGRVVLSLKNTIRREISIHISLSDHLQVLFEGI